MTLDTDAILEGRLDVSEVRLAIVVSRFNEFVTSRLLGGALDALKTAGVPRERVTVARVPGAFEIPLVARRFAASGRFDAVICLGAVVRGETPHFEYISAEVSRAIMLASCDFDLPVIFGVLTTDTAQQALDRAGAGKGNRGADAARAALEMVSLLRRLRGRRGGPSRLTAVRPRGKQRDGRRAR